MEKHAKLKRIYVCVWKDAGQDDQINLDWKFINFIKEEKALEIKFLVILKKLYV